MPLNLKGVKLTTLFIFIARLYSNLIFFIYVVDIILASADLVSIKQVISLMQHDFAIKDLGDLCFFLSIEAIRSDKCLYLFSTIIYSIYFFSVTWIYPNLVLHLCLCLSSCQNLKVPHSMIHISTKVLLVGCNIFLSLSLSLHLPYTK